VWHSVKRSVSLILGHNINNRLATLVVVKPSVSLILGHDINDRLATLVVVLLVKEAQSFVVLLVERGVKLPHALLLELHALNDALELVPVKPADPTRSV